MNLKNMDIYLSRLLSALCLFLILSEANTWLTPLNNTILVMGYRLFILLTPLFFIFCNHRLTFVAFMVTGLGLFALLLDYTFSGCILFSLGIAISGYMLKYYSSFSTKGAAGNKIALNLGSIFSGIAVIFLQNKQLILLYCLFVVAASFFAFLKYYSREKIFNFVTPKNHFQLNGLFTPRGIAWAITGFATGVKLIALVSVLPQFLMSNNHDQLPNWFGILLILNSLIIVIFQAPIMNFMKKTTRAAALLPLFIGMLLIIFSNQLNISYYSGAIIWTFLLSIIECAISYTDKLSQEDGALLFKEASVGIGSAATVFCVRFYGPAQGSLLIGTIAATLLIISLFIFLSYQTKPRSIAN
jgi:hypothetical protein